MKKLNFLIIGKNAEILATLKRLIQSNEGWKADIQDSSLFFKSFLADNAIDVILLSSGLEDDEENEIKVYVTAMHDHIKIIDHYGGGSGLLKNEIFTFFPELATDNH